MRFSQGGPGGIFLKRLHRKESDRRFYDSIDSKKLNRERRRNPNGNRRNSTHAGTIKEIIVKAGDAVKEDEELVILEAMKMENPIVAPATARSKRSRSRKGTRSTRARSSSFWITGSSPSREGGGGLSCRLARSHFHPIRVEEAAERSGRNKLKAIDFFCRLE